MEMISYFHGHLKHFIVQLGYSFYGGINQYCDARAGVYLPMINALRDKTSYVHVQLYNSSPITGLDGTSYNMGTKRRNSSNVRNAS